jgi:hypothetical protein
VNFLLLVYLVGGSIDFDDAQYKVCLEYENCYVGVSFTLLKDLQIFLGILPNYSPIIYHENRQVDP